MSDEEWRDIPDYEGFYQINNIGLVRSLDRKIAHSQSKTGYQFRRGSLLRCMKDKDGYLTYTLCRNNSCRKFRSHRLVLLSFIGYSDLPVNHINGIKDDNRVENLEYCSARDNETHKHKVLLGKKRFGVRKLSGGKYHARIAHKGVTTYIGTFEDEEQAYDSYRNLYFEIHGKYPW